VSLIPKLNVTHYFPSQA